MNQSPNAYSPERGGKRIAFFGGSFDPPHCGHLAVARAARSAFGLDRVLFAPVGAQPLKVQGAVASFEDRIAMTRLAIGGEPGFEVSLVDAPRPAGGPNFTVETLQSLRSGLGPDCILYCLMGADSFFGLKNWHRAAEIPFVAQLIVVSRPGQPFARLKASLPAGLTLESASEDGAAKPNFAADIASGVEVRSFLIANLAGNRVPFYLLPGLDVEISASEIRTAIRAQGSPLETSAAGADALLPATVAEYVRLHGLYR
jgi:nicotinate-nucleotide adenylyltransferase